MGGKRPDQYRIAPDEAGATDYKHFTNEPSDLDAQRDQPSAPETPWSGQHQPRQDGAEDDDAQDGAGYKRRTRASGKRPDSGGDRSSSASSGQGSDRSSR